MYAPKKEYSAYFSLLSVLSKMNFITNKPTIANLLLGYPVQFLNLSPGQAAAKMRATEFKPELLQKAESHTLVSQVNSTRCF
jgi:hypothetical protein